MDRTKTGLPVLDEMLGGGFMRGDVVMVAGSAGTGKTVLALQYLVNGITKFGEKGIYVTFEQLPDQIYRDAKNFGWDLRKMEEENKLRIVCTSPDVMLVADGGESVLDEFIEEIHPQRIVVDSLSNLEMCVAEKELRKEAYRLVNYLKIKGLTPLLTWEVSQTSANPFSISDVGLSFMVDCIVRLKPVEIESSVRKALVMLKMRGSDHDKRLREYEITKSGIHISSPFVGYDSIITGTPRKSMTDAAVESWTKAFRKEKGRD